MDVSPHRRRPHPGRSRGWALGLVLAASIVHGEEPAQERTLHELAARGDVSRLERAISEGAGVDERDEDGQTALHVAAKECHLFAVMLLVAKGANPNARDDEKRTPLHLAADGDSRREGERFQIVKLLIAEGADRRARDAKGKRPVDYAHVPEFEAVLAP